MEHALRTELKFRSGVEKTKNGFFKRHLKHILNSTKLVDVGMLR